MPRNDHIRPVMPGEPTPGQSHASNRKKARKAERAAADKKEADGLGITVAQLHQRRSQEAAPFLNTRRVIHHGSAPVGEVGDRRQAQVRRAG